MTAPTYHLEQLVDDVDHRPHLDDIDIDRDAEHHTTDDNGGDSGGVSPGDQSGQDSLDELLQRQSGRLRVAQR